MRPKDCVMLAAGSSSRMERWKMTLPCGESTVIEESVRAALEVCGRVILVTGFRAQELEVIFRKRERVEIAVNPRFEEGMFSSLQCGCARVRAPRFFVALGDMPLVSAEVYRILLRDPVVDAVIPKYKGKKGHPLLLSKAVARAVLEAGTEGTLRDVLAGFPMITMPVEDPHILHDVDTAEDYHSLIEEGR